MLEKYEVEIADALDINRTVIHLMEEYKDSLDKIFILLKFF